jgi:hypothetical protein
MALGLVLAACTHPQLREASDAGHEPVDETPPVDAATGLDGGSADGDDAAAAAPDGEEVADAAAGMHEDAGAPPLEDGGQDAASDDAASADPDGGSDAGEDASTPACDGGIACTCMDCVCGAELLGTISGDTDGSALQLDGSGAARVEVLVAENDASLGPHDLTAMATLTSTGGTFRLSLLAESLGDSCYGLTESAVGEGVLKVSLRVTDLQGMMGSDESRRVALAVEPVSSGGSWHLLVRGNVEP